MKDGKYYTDADIAGLLGISLGRLKMLHQCHRLKYENAVVGALVKILLCATRSLVPQAV
jgi:hypothetical protein